jgi:hypothetical protein
MILIQNLNAAYYARRDNIIHWYDTFHVGSVDNLRFKPYLNSEIYSYHARTRKVYHYMKIYIREFDFDGRDIEVEYF